MFFLIATVTYVHNKSNESNNTPKYKEESKEFDL